MEDLDKQLLFNISSDINSNHNLSDNTFNKQVFEIKHECSYCRSKKMKEMLYGLAFVDDLYIDSSSIDSDKKLMFCDFACAKLYNDNREKISIDIKKYRLAYINNKLDNKAKNIYQTCSKKCFLLLPKLIVSDDNYKMHKILYLKSI